MRSITILRTLPLVALVACASAYPVSAQEQDSRKDATEATKSANAALLNQLPFSDRSDFEDAR